MILEQDSNNERKKILKATSDFKKNICRIINAKTEKYCKTWKAYRHVYRIFAMPGRACTRARFTDSLTQLVDVQRIYAF